MKLEGWESGNGGREKGSVMQLEGYRKIEPRKKPLFRVSRFFLLPRCEIIIGVEAVLDVLDTIGILYGISVICYLLLTSLKVKDIR
jgi:hypothetical protein